MPERLRQNTTFGALVIALLVCILGLGLYGILASRGLNSALNALKTSSARSECRFAIVNEDEDVFRHAVGDLIQAANNHDDARAAEILAAIRGRVKTQTRINNLCPAPLVPIKEHK